MRGIWGSVPPPLYIRACQYILWPTLCRYVERTATRCCRAHCCTQLHTPPTKCRTAAHCCTAIHTLMPHFRTLPHYRTAAHCCAHCHTLPHAPPRALPRALHTATRTVRTLPCALPSSTAAHTDVAHCRTAAHRRTAGQPQNPYKFT
jgi:hypothetical protein